MNSRIFKLIFIYLHINGVPSTWHLNQAYDVHIRSKPDCLPSTPCPIFYHPLFYIYPCLRLNSSPQFKKKTRKEKKKEREKKEKKGRKNKTIQVHYITVLEIIDVLNGSHQATIKLSEGDQ